MSNNLDEALSALMDDEADELELRRILKEMADSENTDANSDLETELKEKWKRYHIVSASCKQELHTSPSCNLLDRINAELEGDALPIAEQGSSTKVATSNKGVFQFLSQGAIAASVALAVLFTADMVMVADNDGSNGESAVNSTAIAGNNASLNSQPGFTGELNPATQTRVAVQEALDEEEMARLQQVVSEELKDSLQNQETDAVFTP